MTDLYIDTHGNGATHLVLVHGWAMHGGIFAPLTEILQHRYTVHCVDLPGHGRSRRSALPLEPTSVVDAIHRQIPRALWLGWSMGGLFALEAALGHHSEDVPGLIMLSSSPRFVAAADWPQGMVREQFERFATDLAHDYRTTVNRFLALEVLGDLQAHGDLRTLKHDLYTYGEPDPDRLQEGLALLERSDRRTDLPRLGAPSLWIAGRRDRLVSPAAMREASALAGGHYLELQHAAHAGFLGQAAAIAAAIDELHGLLS